MNFIDFLRKIGVLRFGTKKYKYHSGRDMSHEALMDDVYDAKKDLLTKNDIQWVKKKSMGQKEDETN